MEQLVGKVKESRYYSILADEAIDCSVKENISGGALCSKKIATLHPVKTSVAVNSISDNFCNSCL